MQVEGIAQDLSAITDVAGYNEFCAEKLNQLDIGLLALNAGVWEEGPIDLVDDAKIERTLNINVLHVVYLYKALIKKQMARDIKSACLITSSGLAHATWPGLALYCASKALVSNFASAVHFEAKEKIDVTCWEAGPSPTNLGNQRSRKEKPPKAIMSSCEDAVRGALAHTGRYRVTEGTMKHGMLFFPSGDFMGKKMAQKARDKFHAERLANMEQPRQE